MIPELRDAIAAALADVTNIGVVRTSWALPDAETSTTDAYRAVIGGVPMIRGWVVRPDRTALRLEVFGEIAGGLTFTVTGYQGMSEASASETGFDALIEDVLGALNDLDAETIGVSDVLNVGPANIAGSDQVMLGGVLCDRVTIAVPVDVERMV